jgi:nitronate monooxygenase
MWTDRRILDLIGIEHPIIQAPMAGCNDAALVIAVSSAGGLGSLPCAMLSVEQMRTQLDIIRQQTSKPINVNFFCHQTPKPDAAADQLWLDRLAPHYRALGLDLVPPSTGAARLPFNADYCAVIETFKPKVVSFHFGLPTPDLMARVKATGAVVLSSATTVAEAVYLQAHGCDAIIAQGAEAGGHRGIFLTDDPIAGVANQPGTLALVPQIVDAVRVPVIAAGGIADGRGIAAVFALGASAAQIGTAYMLCPEAITSPIHRAALKTATDDTTALTNLFTGRPARGVVNALMREIGPLSRLAPAFPGAASAVLPLRAKAEQQGSGDYSALWSGQAARLAREQPAAALTARLVAETRARLAACAQL